MKRARMYAARRRRLPVELRQRVVVYAGDAEENLVLLRRLRALQPRLAATQVKCTVGARSLAPDAAAVYHLPPAAVTCWNAAQWGRARLSLLGRRPLFDERPEALVVLVVDVAVRLSPGEVVAQDPVGRVEDLRHTGWKWVGTPIRSHCGWCCALEQTACGGGGQRRSETVAAARRGGGVRAALRRSWEAARAARASKHGGWVRGTPGRWVHHCMT